MEVVGEQNHELFWPVWLLVSALSTVLSFTLSTVLSFVLPSVSDTVSALLTVVVIPSRMFCAIAFVRAVRLVT
jgi:hypothetical protein